MSNNEIELECINNLLLDPSNPRLPETVARTQEAMLDYIAQTTSIEELMEAIAQNGFFPGEPVVVTPEGAPEGKLIVIEGNRRVTAVKLLNDPDLLSKKSEKIKSISEHAKYQTSKLPVVKKSTRSEVLPYLGFRHITGVKQWEPLAKARYIEQLYDLTDKNLSHKDREAEVARQIGSRRDHIRRNLSALAVYKQIRDSDFYGIENLGEESIKFAVLSTAVSDDRIGKFVGVECDEDKKPPIEDPISLDKSNIKDLTHWLYARDDRGQTRVGESRNLRQLSAVVANPRALAQFKSGAPLKVAYQQTSDVKADFMELLYQADTALSEAAGMVAGVPYTEESLTISRRIQDTIKLIGREQVEKKRQKEDDDF